MTAALILATLLSAATTGAQAGATPAPLPTVDITAPVLSTGALILDPNLLIAEGDGRTTTLSQRIRAAWKQCAPDPTTPRWNHDHAEACFEHAIITGEDLP